MYVMCSARALWGKSDRSVAKSFREGVSILGTGIHLQRSSPVRHEATVLRSPYSPLGRQREQYMRYEVGEMRSITDER